MRRNLNDLMAFVTVAREGSFTKAAGSPGVTQSALSQAVRGLEERLRIRLLTRTTRSVAPTAAGERLMRAIGHRFDEIEAELDALTELRDKPAAGDIAYYAPWGNLAIFYKDAPYAKGLVTIGRLNSGVEALGVRGSQRAMIELKGK